MQPQIDLIVPWVNGGDPDWQREKARFSGAGGDQRIIRYRDWGLMKYWFRGVEKFLPWVRKIHFVTWGHLPEKLYTENPKLHIIRHSEYIPAKYLPTFSANVIEMNFFRIEELSECFIYANDDMFFLRPLEERFFFRNDLPVDAAIQNVLQFTRSDGIDGMVKNDLLSLNLHFKKHEAIAANKRKWFSPVYGAGMLKNLYLHPFGNFTGFIDTHLPYAYLKSTFREVYDTCTEKLEETFSHKIRTQEDVNQWLCRYWQFASGKFSPGKPNRGRFLVIGKDDAEIERIVSTGAVPMICLSDDEETIDFEKEKQFLTDCFERLLPEKSSFEI